MKKILLGTTTLLGAAGLFAGSAMAETPKVTVGGFADFQVGIMNDDGDANQRAHAFRSDTEVTFRIDGKTDSGLGYGGGVDVEADTTSDADTQGVNAGRTFVYLEGMWGRAEMGSDLGADATMKVDAASIARATGGIDGDWTYFANNRGAVTYVATPDLPLNYGINTGGYGDEQQENVNKVTYYTPRFSGFQLGVSYMPNDRDRGQTLNRADNNNARAENIFVGGINYDNKFGDFGVALAATGEMGDAEVSTYEDLRAWNVGGKLSYMGFSLAGSYGDWADSLRLKTANADDTHYWTVGGAYEYGPFGASVTFLDSSYDAGAVSDSDFQNLAVGADYKLAPGLTPYVEMSWYEADPNGTANDNEGYVFLAGTQLNF